MATTQLDSFTQRCSSFLRDEIFPTIVEYLPRRHNPHVPLTVDELVNVLALPARQLPPPAAVGGVIPPPVGAAPAMTQSVATARKAGSNALDNITPGVQCAYKFARGENKNKFCGKPTVAGGKYCGACIKNRVAVKNEVEGNGGVAPTVGAVPGVPGVPPPAAAAAAQDTSLNVVEYDVSRGLYREPNNNFIIMEVNGVVTAIGKLMTETNQIVELNAQERTIAQGMHIAVQPAAAAAPAVPAPAVPKAPVVPAPVAVPVAPVPVAPVPVAPVPVAVPVAPVPVAPAPVAVPVPAPVAPAPVAPAPVAVPVYAPAPVAPAPVAPAPVAPAPVAVPVYAPAPVAPAPVAVPAIPHIPTMPAAVPQAVGGIPDIPAIPTVVQ